MGSPSQLVEGELTTGPDERFQKVVMSDFCCYLKWIWHGLDLRVADSGDELFC